MVVYTPNDQCSDIVHGFDKNDLPHADFVKINEIIEYNILSILWKRFCNLAQSINDLDFVMHEWWSYSYSLLYACVFCITPENG